MATVAIGKLILTDFKGVRNGEYIFSDITKISAANGLGKTTIATAWYWLTMDKDYELKSNPNVRPDGVEECIPRVDAVLRIDGKKIIITKQQKTTKSKPDNKGVVEIKSANTYEINGAPKTERDFRKYLEDEGIDWTLFLALSHPEVFTGQKASEMRKILFKMVSEKSDLDIAKMSADTLDVADLLTQGYKLAEIEAMHKASKKKAEAQVRDIPNQIIGMEKSKVQYDMAELRKNKLHLEEQIHEKEKLLEDNEVVLAEQRKLTDQIMDLKFQKNSIEQAAQDKLNQERRSIQNRMDIAKRDFSAAVHRQSMVELDIKRLEDAILRRDKERAELGEQYKIKSTENFDDSKLIFPEDSTICPVCGRRYEEGKVSEIKLAFEERKKKAAEDFQKSIRSALEELIRQGNQLKKETAEITVELEGKKEELKNIKEDKIRFNKDESVAMKEISELPAYADISANQEYESLQLQVTKLEEALQSMNNGAIYRSSLKNEIESLRHDLAEIEKQIAIAGRNTEIDKQISELHERQMEYEQVKADSEKILDQLDSISKRKNEFMVGEINSHFGVVKWILFDHYKSGGYKEVCIPTIDGKRFGDSTNTGKEIVAKLDICNSLQKFFGIELPVFLDNAESINDFNLPKLDCQLITLNVTEDARLKVEVSE